MAKPLPAYPSDDKPGTSGLDTITGSALMRLELPEPSSIVPGILVEGLTVLGGKPKLGKSWLMLYACLAVASDGYVLGKLKVTAGEALYLGLEDNLRRLQNRLDTMSDEIPDGLHLASQDAMPRLDVGGLERLDTWLQNHPLCRLVVIDTLARVRPRRKHGADLYEEDATLGASLQALAIKRGVALVVIHHLRKADADDPLDMISGSTGLTGAADAVLVLTRPRGEADAVLHITGRDIEESELALKFDPKHGIWTMLGEAKDYAMSEERRLIVAFLQTVKSGAPKDIAEGAQLPRDSVRQLLRKMKADGLLICPKQGLYAVNAARLDKTVHSVHSSLETPSDTAQTPVNGRSQPRSQPFTAHEPVTAVNEPPVPPFTGKKPVQDSKSKTPVNAVNGISKNVPTPKHIDVLYNRFITGEFNDRPELHGELKSLFSLRRANAEQRARLLELVGQV